MHETPDRAWACISQGTRQLGPSQRVGFGEFPIHGQRHGKIAPDAPCVSGVQRRRCKRLTQQRYGLRGPALKQIAHTQIVEHGAVIRRRGLGLGQRAARFGRFAPTPFEDPLRGQSAPVAGVGDDGGLQQPLGQFVIAQRQGEPAIGGLDTAMLGKTLVGLGQYGKRLGVGSGDAKRLCSAQSLAWRC